MKGFNDTSRSKSPGAVRRALAATGWVLLFVACIVFLRDRYFGVELELEPSNPSAMRIYWAQPGVDFSERDSQAFFSNPERNRYRFVIPAASSPFHLTFKTSEDTGAFSVAGVTISRIAREDRRYPASDFPKRYIRILEVPKAAPLEDNALRFNPGGKNIAFRLDAFIEGRSNKSGRLIALLLGAIGLLLALRYIDAGRAGTWLRYGAVASMLAGWLTPVTGLLAYDIVIVLRALGLTLTALYAYRRYRHWRNSAQARPAATSVFERFSIPTTALFFFPAIFAMWLLQSPIATSFGLSQLASLDTTVRQNFDQYFRARFRNRQDFIHLNAEVKINGLGISTTPKVILGKDGFMFEGRGDRRVEGDTVKAFDNVSDILGRIPFSEDELKRWTKTLEERRDWLAQRGVPYLFVMAPTKAMIYPEKLPSVLAKRLTPTRRYDQLVDYLRKNSTVPVVDLRDALLEAKALKSYPELYYRTDFHWNFYGAYFAYAAITDAANQHYPQLKLRKQSLDEFSININENWAHPRFMLALGLDATKNRDEHYIALKPNDPSKYQLGDLIPEYGIQDVTFPTRVFDIHGKRIAVRTVENPAGTHPQLFVLGDSFIEKTLLYFSPHAKQLLYQRSVLEFPVNVLSQVKPTLVVQEILNMYILREPPVNPPQLRQR